jgi:HSP20 family protein
LDKKKPAVNMKKNGELFEMQVAVPGFAKEDIEITVKDDILTIRGQKETAAEEVRCDFVINEFNTDSFERKFKLNKGIGHEKIKAKCENGVLTLTFIDVPTVEEKWYKKVEVS